MTKPGRPRKPTALKVVQGTAQPSRLNPDEPVPDGPIGDPPAGLCKAERGYWRETVAAAWWLTHADRNVLEQYVQTWQDYQSERKRMKSRGSVYHKGDSGYSQETAYFRNVMKLRDELRRLQNELGLTPASRSNIRAPKRDTKDANPFAING